MSSPGKTTGTYFWIASDNCQKHKGLEVCAYCIMSSHVHMIIGRHGKDSLDGIIRDIKKYTSVQIIKAIKDNPGETEENC
jgi:putative transposase